MKQFIIGFLCAGLFSCVYINFVQAEKTKTIYTYSKEIKQNKTMIKPKATPAHLKESQCHDFDRPKFLENSEMLDLIKKIRGEMSHSILCQRVIDFWEKDLREYEMNSRVTDYDSQFKEVLVNHKDSVSCFTHLYKRTPNNHYMYKKSFIINASDMLNRNDNYWDRYEFYMAVLASDISEVHNLKWEEMHRTLRSDFLTRLVFDNHFEDQETLWILIRLMREDTSFDPYIADSIRSFQRKIFIIKGEDGGDYFNTLLNNELKNVDNETAERIRNNL